MLDSYYEIPAPWYVENLKALSVQCELLNRDHLGDPLNPFKYYGLFSSVEILAQKINELGEDYEIVGLRRHCISGVVVRETGKSYKIIGIAVRSMSKKRVDYIDLIVDTLDTDQYPGELEIEDYFFDALIKDLSQGEAFIKRGGSSTYWKQMRYNVEQ